MKLYIPIEELKRTIEVDLRKSTATDFLREIKKEKGQTLIERSTINKKTKKEEMYLNNEVFSLNRKVEDNIRFRINITEKEFVDGNIEKISHENDSYKIVIILESPHRDEFNYSYKYYAKNPANGRTGINIEKSIFDPEFWRILSDKDSKSLNKLNKNKTIKHYLEGAYENLILLKKAFFEKDEESILTLANNLGLTDKMELDLDYLFEIFGKEIIDIYVVNRICYQTSLGSYYNGKLLKTVRNNIFKKMWSSKEINDDFYNRLFTIKPNLVINSSTKDVDENNYSFTEELVEKINNKPDLDYLELFISNHPSSGLLSNSLKKY